MFDPDVSSVNDLTYDVNGRTCSYEALNDLHPKSRFRRDSYHRSIEQDQRSSSFLPVPSHDLKSLHRSSGIAMNFRNPEEKVMGKVIEGVIQYSLNTSRPKGSMGRLVLTNVRLKFINYNQVNHEEIRRRLFPPFDIHSFMDESLESGTEYDEDIDFLNVYRVEETKKDSVHMLLTVYCMDFRQIQFEIKESEENRSLIDQLLKHVSAIYFPQTSSSSSNTTGSSFYPSTIVKNMSSSNILPYSGTTGMFSTSSSSNAASQALLNFKIIHELPLLWYDLTTEYMYFDRKEWEDKESSWMTKNPIVRITQCNETFQLCKTLPKSFLTLSSVLLSDVTLLHSISSQMTGRRVPVISFSIPVSPLIKLKKEQEERRRDHKTDKKRDPTNYPYQQQHSSGYRLSKTLNRSSDVFEMMMLNKKSKSSLPSPSSPRMQRTKSKTLTRTNSVTGSPLTTTVLHEINDHHFLFRSVHLTEDVSNLLRDKVSPLKVFDLNKEFPKGLLWFEKAHRKLLEAVFAKTTRNFIWNTGKWMKRVVRVLAVVNDVVDSLRHESSVILTEEADNLFNPLISTLIQVVLDPRRRTMTGFESLLSKEWMFITGYANGYPSSMRFPNSVIFTLLMDCMHQLMAFKFNGFRFEFTSLYLIRLYDLQYLPSPFSALSPIGIRDLTASFEDLTKIGLNSSHSSMVSLRIMMEMRRRSSGHSRLSNLSTNTLVKPFDENCLPMTLSDMTVDQLLFMFNPLFDAGNKSSNILVPKRAAELFFFEALYLRWHWMGDKNLSYYKRFPPLQELCFEEVLNTIERRKNWQKEQEDGRVGQDDQSFSSHTSIKSCNQSCSSSAHRLHHRSSHLHPNNRRPSASSSKENVVAGTSSSSYSETEL